MLQWTKRYRYFLKEKVRVNSPIPLVELQWQMLPWFIPLLIAGLTCYLFDLNSPENLFVIVPLGAITLFGMMLVGWAFVIERPIADYETPKRPSDD